MSDKCAYPKCGKELIHIEGRKKKKYCGSSCKTAHWQALNPIKKKPKTRRIPIEEYDNLVKLATKTLEINKESLNTVTHYGEKKEATIVDKSLIAQYEQELTTLPDKGLIANARRKWLMAKIEQLKYNK